MATILVVDDELGIRALLSEILTDEGHTVELAEDAAQARQIRESLRPDLPPDLIALMKRATDVDRNRRPATCHTVTRGERYDVMQIPSVDKRWHGIVDIS